MKERWLGANRHLEILGAAKANTGVDKSERKAHQETC